MKQVYVAITLITFSALSCSRGSSTTTEDPFLQVNKQIINLNGGISRDTIHVNSNVDWTATKDADATWLTVAPVNGTGNGDIVITTSDSNLLSGRTTSIDIKTTTGSKSVTVVVNQSIFSGLISSTIVGGENDDGSLTLPVRMMAGIWLSDILRVFLEMVRAIQVQQIYG